MLTKHIHILAEEKLYFGKAEGLCVDSPAIDSKLSENIKLSKVQIALKCLFISIFHVSLEDKVGENAWLIRFFCSHSIKSQTFYLVVGRN